MTTPSADAVATRPTLDGAATQLAAAAHRTMNVRSLRPRGRSRRDAPRIWPMRVAWRARSVPSPTRSWQRAPFARVRERPNDPDGTSSSRAIVTPPISKTAGTRCPAKAMWGIATSKRLGPWHLVGSALALDGGDGAAGVTAHSLDRVPERRC
jgi:hypothetical protein